MFRGDQLGEEVMAHEWRFPCKFLRNYDGDTLTVEMDLGFTIKRTDSIRLSGVDTPELRGGTKLTKQYARYVRDRVEEFVNSGKDVIFICEDWSGKYGRPLGDIEVDGQSLRNRLLRLGLGVKYDGGNREQLGELHQRNAEDLLRQGLIAVPTEGED